MRSCRPSISLSIHRSTRRIVAPPATTHLPARRGRKKHAMTLRTLEDLRVHQIQDILSAEHHVKKVLPLMAKAVRSDKLRRAFKHHQKEADAQIERLEKVFGLSDSWTSQCPRPTVRRPKGSQRRPRATWMATATATCLDAGLVIAGQRFQHYEIAAYGSAIAFARQLKHDEVASLLEESLDEEKAADQKLTTIAENGVNEAALKAGRKKTG